MLGLFSVFFKKAASLWKIQLHMFYSIISQAIRNTFWGRKADRVQWDGHMEESVGGQAQKENAFYVLSLQKVPATGPFLLGFTFIHAHTFPG